MLSTGHPKANWRRVRPSKYDGSRTRVMFNGHINFHFVTTDAEMIGV
jgi:hypothetical protein